MVGDYFYLPHPVYITINMQQLLRNTELWVFMTHQKSLFTSRHTAAICPSSIHVSVTTSVNEPPSRYSIITYVNTYAWMNVINKTVAAAATTTIKHWQNVSNATIVITQYRNFVNNEWPFQCFYFIDFDCFIGFWSIATKAALDRPLGRLLAASGAMHWTGSSHTVMMMIMLAFHGSL